MLRYFQQEEWQSLFDETWSTCKGRITRIIPEISKLRSSIENHSNPHQVERTRAAIQDSREGDDPELDERILRRLREVHIWLNATNVEIDQEAHSRVRADYPETGKWLLENSSFKEWFDPNYVTDTPLLWINGMAGAGKTFLASLSVEQCRSLMPEVPTTLFFYCKEGNSDRDTFVAVARGLLSQFLKQNADLLDTFYQKSCRSGEKTLTSNNLITQLLNLAFRASSNAYVVLDGLDECPRAEQKRIVGWFQELAEGLPDSKVRCIFFSRHDGWIQRLFTGVDSIKISADKNHHDIENYSLLEALKLRETCQSLPEDTAKMIARDVVKVSKGQFLLARLIWNNLSSHTSVARLRQEVEPGVFPTEINEAYRRTLVRLEQETPEQARADIFRLLGWLVCAKRPLKWYEIQAMKSIDLNQRKVDSEHHSFVKTHKNLC
ncbi:hypothetical protein F5Y16DRAFT_393125 [Xylariaceae sp. FL0255]|nr:hypothetical protein F5Y16DRAFT_393125 [Xylariaceae sp. FL0255]